MIKKLFFIVIILFVSQITLSYSSQLKSDFYLKYKWLDNKLYGDIIQITETLSLDPALVCAIIEQESRGKQYARGRAGERGLMQVQAVHYPRDPQKLFDKRINILAGCIFLKLCQNSASSIDDTLRYYNAGRNNKWGNYNNWSYISDIKRLAEI